MQITWQQMTDRVFRSDLVLVQDGDGHKIASVFLNGDIADFNVGGGRTFRCDSSNNQNIVMLGNMIYLMDRVTEKEFIISLYKSYNI